MIRTRSLTYLVVAIACVAMALPASADTKFGDHEHQRDVPQIEFGLQVVRPYVGGPPLLVESDGEMVEASSELTPMDAWVYIDLQASWGERPGDELIVRMKNVEVAKLYRDRKRSEEWLRNHINDAFVRNIILGESPFEVYIETRGLTPGRSYGIELLGIRNDRRYGSKKHSFYLDLNAVSA